MAEHESTPADQQTATDDAMSRAIVRDDKGEIDYQATKENLASLLQSRQ